MSRDISAMRSRWASAWSAIGTSANPCRLPGALPEVDLLGSRAPRPEVAVLPGVRSHEPGPGFSAGLLQPESPAEMVVDTGHVGGACAAQALVTAYADHVHVVSV